MLVCAAGKRPLWTGIIRMAELGQRPYFQTDRLLKLPVKERKFRILWFGSDEFSARTLAPVLEADDLWSSIDIVSAAEPFKSPLQKKRDGQKPAPVIDLRAMAKQHRLGFYAADKHGIRGFKLPPAFDSPDPRNLVITASFGQLITARLRDPFEPQHSLNVHPSLLPKYRGAAPIQYAILDGVKETGVAIQRLIAPKYGVDCGPIVKLSDPVDIAASDDYMSLMRRLADTAGPMLVNVLRDLQQGKIEVDVQRGLPSKAPKITKGDASIRWNEWTSQVFDRKFRAFGHQAPLHTTLSGLKVIFHRLRLPSQEDLDDLRLGLQERGVTTVSPGDAFISKRRKHLMISTARRGAGSEADPSTEDASDRPPPYIVVGALQTEGRNALDAWDWWNGLSAAQKGGVRFGPASNTNASGFIPYSAKPAPKPKAPVAYPAFDFSATATVPPSSAQDDQSPSPTASSS